MDKIDNYMVKDLDDDPYINGGCIHGNKLNCPECKEADDSGNSGDSNSGDSVSD